MLTLLNMFCVQPRIELYLTGITQPYTTVTITIQLKQNQTHTNDDTSG